MPNECTRCGHPLGTLCYSCLESDERPQTAIQRQKAELADEIGLAGHRHSKQWWDDWYIRYDRLRILEREAVAL